MRKPQAKRKAARVVYFGHRVYRTRCHEYIQPIPYDKKRKEIPTSVNCFFNTEYFTLNDALLTMITI